MFCRNCGREINGSDPVCAGCGTPPGSGDRFCPRCGHPTQPPSGFCINCGAPLSAHSGPAAPYGHSSTGQAGTAGPGGVAGQGAPFGPGPGMPAPQPPVELPPVKRRVTAGLLGIFLGGIGAHNFYLGFTGKGILQAVLFVLCCGVPSMLWGFVEGVMILSGFINTDAQGAPLWG